MSLSEGSLKCYAKLGKSTNIHLTIMIGWYKSRDKFKPIRDPLC